MTGDFDLPATIGISHVNNWTGMGSTGYPSIISSPTSVPTYIPGTPPPNYTFNIVILANGKNIPLDADDLADKIGKAIAAAFATKEAQELVEELAE